MPILFIGNALNTKPDGTTGWFPRAIIPVSSIEEIPTTFIKRSGGFQSTTINLSPKPANVGTFATEAPHPQEFPFPKFTWQNIVLTNFQLDLYYMLKDAAEGEPVNLLNMPKYTDVYRDSQWEVKTEGAISHKKRTNNKRFVVEKLYLCASEEFYEWTKNNNKEVTEEGTTESDLAYGSQSRSKVNPYNVWYAVGTFYEPSQASASDPVEDSEAEVVKPIALSAARDSEDFTKAYIYGEQLMTINEGEYSSDVRLKVKFIFDNGVEKYAEVIEVPSEIAITSSAQAATIEAASNVPDIASNINPQLDSIADSAPNVDIGRITQDTLVNSDDIGLDLDVQNLDNALGSSAGFNDNATNLANKALAGGRFRFR